MFSRNEYRRFGGAFLAVLVFLVVPVWAGQVDSPANETSSASGGGLSSRLLDGNRNFTEECGYLVNEKSSSALEPFFNKERPQGEGLATQAHSPSSGRIFLMLLAEIFNIASDPCP
ncbi:MAG: hypothetical protein O6947_02760 [Acidobacteria bacterium]|nr:hypothetical protein [Acidobacteriota bacterium]